VPGPHPVVRPVPVLPHTRKAPRLVLDRPEGCRALDLNTRHVIACLLGPAVRRCPPDTAGIKGLQTGASPLCAVDVSIADAVAVVATAADATKAAVVGRAGAGTGPRSEQQPIQ
jgi:hypothetical protein